MRLPLSFTAHAVRHDPEMSVRVVFTRFLSQGKRVLKNWQKAVKATQNKQVVKVAQKKPVYEQKASTRPSSQLQPLWNRLIPRVYYRTLAVELRRRAAWKTGSPLVAFLGLALVQNQENEEIVEEICELVKDRQTRQEVTLFDKIQSLSLDELEIGRLIGKGCNAAVHEARLKTPYNEEDEEPVTESDEVTSDVNSDVNSDISESINHIDELLEAMEETENSVTSSQEAHDDVISNVMNDVTETGSDITVLDFSEDGISDDEAAPTMFLVQSVVEKVPYISRVDDDIESDTSFEIIDEQSDTLEDMLHHKESLDPGGSEAEVNLLTMTHSRILLTIPQSDGTVQRPEDGVDGVVESDLEYDSMNSSVSGEKTPVSRADFNLAVKMMFNYGLASNSFAIFEGMQKEALPARVFDEKMERDYLQNGHKVRKKLPPHPNIVEMWCVFVDEVSHLPSSFKDYPDALPKRINPEGMGRNMTMYLVMKKYDGTLKEYLSNNSPSYEERLCLFAQLLEAIVHLQNHGIAHRDIKSNNILLDCSQGGVPQLVLSDFGCCLADAQNGLRIPYNTDAISKDGNMALMAPEILNVQPGPFSVLDYSKADLWAVGALAYEMFGGSNPFYAQLNSASYREEDLPPLPYGVPADLQRLISQMLRRDPAQRPTPAYAANVVEVLLWMPDSWSLLSNINHMFSKNRSDWQLPSNDKEANRGRFTSWLKLKYQLLKSDIKLWTAMLAVEVLFGKKNTPEHQLKINFLNRLKTREILSVLSYCSISVLEG